MKKHIYDEKNGLWYELHGDYYLPCLALPEGEDKPIGVWGQRHLRYIRESKRALYVSLLTSGKLNGYLADVDERTNDLFLRLVKELSEKEGLTEKLKAEDMMAWVRKINHIRAMAKEIVEQEIIYT